MPVKGRMPDFFIVGAPRCGTGALYYQLGMHPHVYAPTSKEPHFFVRDFNAPGFFTDLDEYVALYSGAGDARRVGDGSVWSLYSEVAPRLIRESVPDAKAIVMMRDPVELMRSLHARNVVYGDEDISDFAQALAAEPDRQAGRRLPPGGAFPQALLYTRVARLGEQVTRLLESFPREDVHFAVLEDLATDPAKVYSDVLKFLEVDDWQPESFRRYNPNRRERSSLVKRLLYQDRFSLRAMSRALLSPRRRMILRSTSMWRRISRANAPVAERDPLDPILRDQLRDLLAADVALLGEIVGRDLAGQWWGRVSAS